MTAVRPLDWADRGWATPARFLASAEAEVTVVAPAADLAPVDSVDQAKLLLHRRCVTPVSAAPLAATAFRAVLSVLWTAERESPWLLAGLAIQSVEGQRPGCYLLRRRPRRLEMARTEVPEEILVRTSQGQKFVLGGGLAIYLGTRWLDATQPAMAEADYADRLITIGRIGQALVNAGWRTGGVGRMTPALEESAAQELFAGTVTEADGDFLYLLKLGARRAE